MPDKLTERFIIDCGMFHTCTLDSMVYRFGHDCVEMDKACFVMDSMLAVFLPLWLKSGYEVIVTPDHGQTDRGHHCGHEDEQQETALYWFGGGDGPETGAVIDQLQLAPTILSRLGVPVPYTMKAEPFIP